MKVAKARCVEVDCKRKRSMFAKFRGGTAELQIKSGRWRWSLVHFAYHFTILWNASLLATRRIILYIYVCIA